MKKLGGEEENGELFGARGTLRSENARNGFIANETKKHDRAGIGPVMFRRNVEKKKGQLIKTCSSHLQTLNLLYTTGPCKLR